MGLNARRLILRFSDRVDDGVDLHGALDGSVFLPRRDGALFAQVRLDPEIRTPAWPDGADLAPELLRALLEQRNPSQRGNGRLPLDAVHSHRIDDTSPRMPVADMAELPHELDGDRADR
jgi:hypothetical protein